MAGLMERGITKDRVMGCLLGGALGDAWGVPWEGTKGPVAFSVPSHSRVSDDTQLTLATCQSIATQGHVDSEHVASQFLAQFKGQGIRGIGSSTLKAMRDLDAGVHWALAGARGEYAAGNGAAMRVAPLAFLLDPTDARDRTVIRDVCRITHHHEEAYVGALAVVIAIRSVLEGYWPDRGSFLRIAAGSLPDSAVCDRIKDLLPLQSAPSEVGARFGASGYVVDTVPLALYCAQFIVSKPLSEVLAQAVGIGGDTDTIASITGQLAGTVAGRAGIPSEYLDGIEGSNEVIRVAERFADIVCAGGIGAE